jgi:predicted RNA-binding protein with RPS1 domain
MPRKNTTVPTEELPEQAALPPTDADDETTSEIGEQAGDLPRTETETVENPPSEPKPKMPRRRKAVQANVPADAAQEGGAISSESGGEAIGLDQTQPLQSPVRRKPRRSSTVVAIDEQRTVETPSDKLKNDLLDLVESLKGKKILTGTIQGIERTEENPDISYAVIYHGDFKVIIPAEQAVDPPESFRDRKPSDVMHYLITKRLGAEVDYIVKGVDAKTGIAASSRLEAMAQKRRQYYYGTDRDGNNLLYEGASAEARIVSSIRAGIFVDLFGLEVYIPLKELSYQRWMDAASHYQPGQRVLVKILELDRKGRDDIHVTASVKQAGANPYELALRRYSIGSRYVGTVSLVDTTGVFVSLDGGIDCLCSYPKRGRPPRGTRVTVRILGINYDANRIWGAITHMTSR